jgi:hypothetical protein
MKKVVDYRKLLGVDKTAGLKELKTVYRNFMKECHPDKFLEENDLKLEAEARSKTIIEAYHFLVSIAPETTEQGLPEYTNTITTSNIADFNYKSQTLQIKFLDGSAYEYLDVPKAVYVKLINSDSQGRFARRHIFNSYVYRNISNIDAFAQ